ncbi:hypothetical protein PPERSA_11339 [Pseudocohnilembus persalinus]|uniref:Uncharacterized protein n=1 Tax=Pseudocohnilembus persalinus TaxID=266149 RepID=A0A0V0QQ50_PSEPJ|nr:hypothetical protein PPERSA_11339 [Pseudocohnilembus persalinus]|eukprot:KRX04215.1 hypothetical protein PPERSA_11339 [Pseudocohnilembus persalinus]
MDFLKAIKKDYNSNSQVGSENYVYQSKNVHVIEEKQDEEKELIEYDNEKNLENSNLEENLIKFYKPKKKTMFSKFEDYIELNNYNKEEELQQNRSQIEQEELQQSNKNSVTNEQKQYLFRIKSKDSISSVSGQENENFVNNDEDNKISLNNQLETKKNQDNNRRKDQLTKENSFLENLKQKYDENESFQEFSRKNTIIKKKKTFIEQQQDEIREQLILKKKQQEAELQKKIQEEKRYQQLIEEQKIKELEQEKLNELILLEKARKRDQEERLRQIQIQEQKQKEEEELRKIQEKNNQIEKQKKNKQIQQEYEQKQQEQLQQYLMQIQLEKEFKKQQNENQFVQNKIQTDQNLNKTQKEQEIELHQNQIQNKQLQTKKNYKQEEYNIYSQFQNISQNNNDGVGEKNDQKQFQTQDNFCSKDINQNIQVQQLQIKNPQKLYQNDKIKNFDTKLNKFQSISPRNLAKYEKLKTDGTFENKFINDKNKRSPQCSYKYQQNKQSQSYSQSEFQQLMPQLSQTEFSQNQAPQFLPNKAHYTQFNKEKNNRKQINNDQQKYGNLFQQNVSNNFNEINKNIPNFVQTSGQHNKIHQFNNSNYNLTMRLLSKQMSSNKTQTPFQKIENKKNMEKMIIQFKKKLQDINNIRYSKPSLIQNSRQSSQGIKINIEELQIQGGQIKENMDRQRCSEDKYNKFNQIQKQISIIHAKNDKIKQDFKCLLSQNSQKFKAFQIIDKKLLKQSIKMNTQQNNLQCGHSNGQYIYSQTQSQYFDQQQNEININNYYNKQTYQQENQSKYNIDDGQRAYLKAKRTNQNNFDGNLLPAMQ